ncbi:hypothetical protein BDV97DRAFT_146957 [Delphinella strobiligena]|nr:hypothetical protein BDV97DRAFT_146957 [Delphinella strobiligena]
MALTPSANNITDPYSLGYSVLRSMYAVFDIDNGQISLTQAYSNRTLNTSVVEVPAGPNGLWSALQSRSNSVITVSTKAALDGSLISATATSTHKLSLSTVSSAPRLLTGSDAIPLAGRSYGVSTSTPIVLSSGKLSAITSSATSTGSSPGATESRGAAIRQHGSSDLLLLHAIAAVIGMAFRALVD